MLKNDDLLQHAIRLETLRPTNIGDPLSNLSGAIET